MSPDSPKREQFLCPFFEHSLAVDLTKNGLVQIQFQQAEPPDFLSEPRSSLARDIQRTLMSFLNGAEMRSLDLPIDWRALNPPPFYKRVWQELKQVPWGERVTYGELAQRAGSPKAARAAGAACRANPLLLVIPCHRVVGRQGLGGFSGGGLRVKERLLAREL